MLARLQEWIVILMSLYRHSKAMISDEIHFWKFVFSLIDVLANCDTFKRQQAKCCQTLFFNQRSFETSSALLQTAAYLYWAFQRLFKQYFPKFNDNILTFQNPSIKFGWSPFLSINCICIKYVYGLWWAKRPCQCQSKSKIISLQRCD